MFFKRINKYFKETKGIKYVFPIFFAWKIINIFSISLGENLFKFKYSFPYINSSLLEGSGLPHWVWSSANFDGIYYLDIAMRGYAADGVQVFFPLYPIFIRFLSFFTTNFILSGILISNLAIIVAALLIYKYAYEKKGMSIALWSVIFLFSFPTAFFFGNIYGESLFLLLILLCFLGEGWISLLSGVLASGTRLVGLFSAVIIIFKGKKINLLGSLTVLGLIGYILFHAIVYHRPFAFLEAQSAFKNSRATSITQLVTPFHVVFRYLKIFLSVDVHELSFWIAFLEFSSFVFFLLFLGYVTLKKKLNLGLLIYCWSAFLIPVVSGTFQSLPRYVLVIFPIYWYLASIKNMAVKSMLVIFFVVIQIILSALFAQGYFVS